jgi:hypothetical protein
MERYLVPLALCLGLSCGGEHDGATSPTGSAAAELVASLPTLSDLTEKALVEDPPNDPVEFVFKWPERPFAVAETIWKAQTDKPSTTCRTRYTLQVEARDGGWILRSGPVQLLSINGLPVEAAHESVRAVLACNAARPTQWIEADGLWGGLDDYDGFVASLGPILDAAGASWELRRATLAMAANPSMRSMVENRAAEPWRSWVEAWAGLEATPGEQWETATEIEMAPGVILPARFRYTFHGFVNDPPGHVLLEEEVIMGGDTDALLGLVKNLARDAEIEIREDAEVPEMTINSVNRVLLITDPRTLVPHHATIDRVNRVEGPDTETVIRHDTYEWVFEADA